MSQKNATAERIAELLGIKYVHAVRLIRMVPDTNADMPFSDLAHACRAIKEREEATSKRKRSRYGPLPKGAGRVNCTHCDATAAADGKGSPIVIKHDDGCPEKYSVKDHPYDAGHPRDDSNGCIASLWTSDGSEEWYEPCGQSLAAHAHSEYPEDER